MKVQTFQLVSTSCLLGQTKCTSWCEISVSIFDANRVAVNSTSIESTPRLEKSSDLVSGSSDVSVSTGIDPKKKYEP